MGTVTILPLLAGETNPRSRVCEGVKELVVLTSNYPSDVPFYYTDSFSVSRRKPPYAKRTQVGAALVPIIVSSHGDFGAPPPTGRTANAVRGRGCGVGNFGESRAAVLFGAIALALVASGAVLIDEELHPFEDLIVRIEVLLSQKLLQQRRYHVGSLRFGRARVRRASFQAGVREEVRREGGPRASLPERPGLIGARQDVGRASRGPHHGRTPPRTATRSTAGEERLVGCHAAFAAVRPGSRQRGQTSVDRTPPRVWVGRRG